MTGKRAGPGPMRNGPVGGAAQVGEVTNPARSGWAE